MAAKAPKDRIQAMNWGQLRDLWSQVKSGNARRWPAGKALELLVLRAFQLDNAVVTWPYRVYIDNQEIEQIDGAVHFEGLSCLVECKDTVGAMNVEPIAKLRNQLLRRPSSVVGIVFSKGGFTEPAQTLAQFLAPQTVLMCGGEEIEYLLGKEQIVRPFLSKYRYCVEYGIPNFDVRVETVP